MTDGDITIIAGSRTITDYATVEHGIAASGFVISEVVSGHASPLAPDYLDNVDRLGERWAREHGIPCRLFPADWKQHGKAAGPIRNHLMADYAQALIAIWDSVSRGTEHMIAAARARGCRVFVYEPFAEIDWTPPAPTSRVPIFCEVCRKEGKVDREKQTITGAVMPLLDFLADKPRVCTRCQKKA